MINPLSHWKELPSHIWAGKTCARMFEHKLMPLNVMRSISTTSDGAQWLHVSVSRSDRLPSWIEISKVKDEFIGPDMPAYHCIPRKEDYVNLHRFCMHLWAPISGCGSLPNLQDLVDETAV